MYRKYIHQLIWLVLLLHNHDFFTSFLTTQFLLSTSKSIFCPYQIVDFLICCTIFLKCKTKFYASEANKKIESGSWKETKTKKSLFLNISIQLTKLKFFLISKVVAISITAHYLFLIITMSNQMKQFRFNVKVFNVKCKETICQPDTVLLKYLVQLPSIF